LATAGGGVIQTASGTSMLNGSKAAVNNTGALAVNAATELDLAGAIQNSGTITADGTVSQTGTVALSAGSLVNQAGGAWNVGGGSAIALVPKGTGSFTNAGAFAKASGTTAATMGVSFADTGTVSVASGTLSFTGATNSFAGDISGDGTIEFGAASQSAINAGATIETAGWTIDSAKAKALINTTLNYGGAFSLANGTVTIAAGKTLALTGASTFNGAIVNGAGTLTTSGTTTTTGVSTVGGTVTWQNNGVVTVTGQVTLGDTAKNKVVFTNGAKGAVNLVGANGFNLGGAATSVFQNIGALGKSGTGTTSHIKVSVVDTGTITVTQGTLEFDGAASSFAGKISGAGTIAFGGGVNTINTGIGGGIGNVLIANAGTQVVVKTPVNLTGNMTQQAGTTITLGNNQLGLGSAGSSVTLAGTISGTGAASALGLLGGTVTLNAGLKLLAKNWGIGNGVKVIDNFTGEYDGAVAVGTSALTLNKISLTLGGAVTFVGSTLDGGEFRSRGAITAKGLTIGGGIKWLNYGTVTETASVAIGDAAGKTATIYNEPKAVYTLTANAGITLASGATGSFENGGTLQKTGSSNSSSIVAVPVANNDAVIVSGGKLDFGSSVAGTGTMTILKGATLELDGTVTNTQTVDFAGAGGNLDLTHAAKFFGSITDFSSAADVIELVGFNKTAKLSFAPNAKKTGGTLTVTEGSLKASIALFGQYVASGFKTAGDAAGGIDLTYIPPKTALTDIAPHH
jgi:hypothetical protein